MRFEIGYICSVFINSFHPPPTLGRYDEGTAFMPIVEHTRNLPVLDKHPFLALDADGYDLPSDW